tara:strand:- start:290 stop:514 length:225 start_codon:yes stop_codon:yes gene_type:complete
MSDKPDCILCDLPVHPWTDGHNARPLEGRVCDACHPIALFVRMNQRPMWRPSLIELRILGKAERDAFDAKEASA